MLNLLELAKFEKCRLVIAVGIFRCVHASLYEALSVRPSVRPSVRRSVPPSRIFFVSKNEISDDEAGRD